MIENCEVYLSESNACSSDVPSNKNSGIYITNDDVSEVEENTAYCVNELLGKYRPNGNIEKYRTVTSVRKARVENTPTTERLTSAKCLFRSMN